jgi:phage antirepressor YoqD-like protein
MNELTFSEKTMTVKEVAEQLGCNPETIKGHIRELFPDLMRNGKTTYLNEAQATVVLESIKKSTAEHRGLESVNLQRSVVGVETTQSRALRINLLHRQIEAEMRAEIDEQKARAERAESKLAIAEPKAAFFDQVADSQDALQMRDVAAALNIPDMGRNKIFELLRKKNILDDRNVPYREYQDRGYFRVVEQKWTDKEGETHISLKTLVYQRGMDFIRKTLTHGGAA